MLNEVRRKRKERVGIVVSDKMDKTITVRISRVAHHPKYEKLIKQQSKIKAHDEKKEAKMGDTVRIVETRPISKTKRWRLLEVVKSQNVNEKTQNVTDNV